MAVSAFLGIALDEGLPVRGKVRVTEASLELARLQRPVQVPNEDGGVRAARGEGPVVS